MCCFQVRLAATLYQLLRGLNPFVRNRSMSSLFRHRGCLVLGSRDMLRTSPLARRTYLAVKWPRVCVIGVISHLHGRRTCSSFRGMPAQCQAAWRQCVCIARHRASARHLAPLGSHCALQAIRHVSCSVYLRGPKETICEALCWVHYAKQFHSVASAAIRLVADAAAGREPQTGELIVTGTISLHRIPGTTQAGPTAHSSGCAAARGCTLNAQAWRLLSGVLGTFGSP